MGWRSDRGASGRTSGCCCTPSGSTGYCAGWSCRLYAGAKGSLCRYQVVFVQAPCGLGTGGTSYLGKFSKVFTQVPSDLRPGVCVVVVQVSRGLYSGAK